MLRKPVLPYVPPVLHMYALYPLKGVMGLALRTPCTPITLEEGTGLRSSNGGTGVWVVRNPEGGNGGNAETMVCANGDNAAHHYPSAPLEAIQGLWSWVIMQRRN